MSISTAVVEALNELGFALTPKPEFDMPYLPRDNMLLRIIPSLHYLHNANKQHCR